MQYHLEWKKVDPATVAATLTLTLSKADLLLSDTVLFQDSLRSLHGFLARGVLLTGEPAAAAPAAHP